MIPKFRAWDKVINQMFIPDSIHFDPKGMVDGIGSKETIFGIEDFELMQSIGLHDNNGKEIFEGDIVKATDETVGKIEYNNGIWYVMHKNPINNHFLSIAVQHGIKIIGNIHEHKHLLENV